MLGEYNNGKSPLDSIEDDDDEDEEDTEIEATVAGTIEIELQDGSVVEVDADEYLSSLKNEANSLKQELQRLKSNGGEDSQVTEFLVGGGASPQGARDDPFNGLAEYIASRQGDIQSLTEGISPEIVETMKMLVDYVLEGGESGKARKKGVRKEEMNMELPASALQQLALWQLILGKFTALCYVELSLWPFQWRDLILDSEEACSNIKLVCVCFLCVDRVSIARGRSQRRLFEAVRVKTLS